MARNTNRGFRVGMVRGAHQIPIKGKWVVINRNTKRIYVRSKRVKGIRVKWP